jgi:hypothetical protein
MDFTFNTPGGKFKIDRTQKSLTPFGGLVAFASFLSSLGVIDKLVDTCPIHRTSNNATPVRDLVVGFILPAYRKGNDSNTSGMFNTMLSSEDIQCRDAFQGKMRYEDFLKALIVKRERMDVWCKRFIIQIVKYPLYT